MPGKPNKTGRDLLIGTVGSTVASLLLYAAMLPTVDLPSLARYMLGIVGVAALAWFGLPWVVVGLTYLALHKIGKAETWMKRRLVGEAFPQSHYLRTMFDPTYRGETVYSATAFVVSKLHSDKLLWVMHRTHRRWMPPGGRLQLNELPHEAVKTKVCAETGLTIDSLTFCAQFVTLHSDHVTQGEPVEPVSVPWVVQREDIEQRGGIPYHYDFIYVLEANSPFSPHGDQSPQWLSIAEVEKHALQNQPFPNTLNLARKIMKELGAEYKA